MAPTRGSVVSRSETEPDCSFMLIDLLGFFFSWGFDWKDPASRPHEAVKGWMRRWFTHPVATRIPVDRDEFDQSGPCPIPEGPRPSTNGLPSGFTGGEQANSVEFACDHRVDQKLRPVRCSMRPRQRDGQQSLFLGRCIVGPVAANTVIRMPGRLPTWATTPKSDVCSRNADWMFRTIPGFWGRNTSRRAVAIHFYDVDDVPASHREDLRVMIRDLEKAGAQQALERCAVCLAPREGLSPERHTGTSLIAQSIGRMSVQNGDYRRNAAFLIGRRDLTKGTRSGRACFLALLRS